MATGQGSDTKPAPVLTPTEAKQGFRGKHILWVLVISMGLIVVIYAAMVGGIWGGRLSRPGGQSRADQATINQKAGATTLVTPKQSESAETQK